MNATKPFFPSSLFGRGQQGVGSSKGFSYISYQSRIVSILCMKYEAIYSAFIHSMAG